MHELRGYVAPARRRLLRVLLVLGSALPAKASSDGKNGRLVRAAGGNLFDECDSNAAELAQSAFDPLAPVVITSSMVSLTATRIRISER
jgi:hypothetical protein